MTAVVAVPARIDRRGIGMLAFGHLSVDLVQGAVPPLLPFLVSDRGYSYAAAGSLLLFSSLGSSLLQPVLGAIADRVRASWLMPVGAALAALGIGLVGITNSYLATGAALAVASVGVAMYHPEAVRFAGYVSIASGRRGAGMSVFAVGGIAGWALAPAIVTPAVLIFGLPGVTLVAIVPLVAALVLSAQLGYVEQYRPARLSEGARRVARTLSPSRWGAFSLAAGAATARTGVQFGLQAYVPLYLWRGLHTTQGPGEHRRDRAAVGRRGRCPARWTDCGSLRLPAARRVVAGRSRCRSSARSRSCPVPGVFLLMALIGLTMEANFYPLALTAQNALPRHIGFSAGVMLGVSIGVGACHLVAARRARRRGGASRVAARDRRDRAAGVRARACHTSQGLRPGSLRPDQHRVATRIADPRATDVLAIGVWLVTRAAGCERHAPVTTRTRSPRVRASARASRRLCPTTAGTCTRATAYLLDAPAPAVAFGALALGVLASVVALSWESAETSWAGSL